IRTVFMIARWCLYADFSMCLAPFHPDALTGEAPASEEPAKRAQFPAMLGSVVGRLTAAGSSVWLVQSAPEYRVNVRTRAPQALLLGLSDQALELPREKYLAANEFIFGVIRKLDDGRRVREIVTGDVLCPGRLCRPSDADGIPYYRDTDHLNVKGAELL